MFEENEIASVTTATYAPARRVTRRFERRATAASQTRTAVCVSTFPNDWINPESHCLQSLF